MKKIVLLLLLVFTGIFCVSCSSKETISLSGESSVEVGKTLALEATVNLDDPIFVWTSSDENIATVENGIVSAKSKGKVTITVTVENGDVKEASKEITVTEPSVLIEVASTSFELSVGTTKLLEAVATGNPELLYSSSNSNVATVSSSGLIQAIAEGEAVITISTTDNSASKNVTVVVVKGNLSTPSALNDALKNLNDEYSKALSVSFELYLKNLEASSDSEVTTKVSYKIVDNVMTELEFVQNRSTTAFVYLKDSYVYTNNNNEAYKYAVNELELARLLNYNFEKVAKIIIDLVNDSSLFSSLEFLTDSNNVLTFNINLDEYKDGVFNFDGYSKGELKVSLTNGAISSLELLLDETYTLKITYLGTNVAINFPQEINSYPEG